MKLCLKINYFDDNDYNFKVAYPEESTFIELGNSCTNNEVGIFIGSLLSLNELSLNTEFIDALYKEDEIALVGGIVFEKDGMSIHPSCCADLEDWRDIVEGLSERKEAWMGHDPLPWLEYYEENITLWSDEKEKDGVYKLEFKQSEVQSMIASLEKDLGDFLNKVDIWASEYYKEAPEKLTTAIKHFVKW